MFSRRVAVVRGQLIGSPVVKNTVHMLCVPHNAIDIGKQIAEGLGGASSERFERGGGILT